MTPIQKLTTALQLGQMISENQAETKRIFTTVLNMMSELKLTELEEMVINKAYIEGRFHRPQIDKPVNNYYDENYKNNKKNDK